MINNCIAIASLSALSSVLLFYKPIMEKISYKYFQYLNSYLKKQRPNRIIIIRHGESIGNINVELYKTTPDNQMTLTDKGKSQAFKAGQNLKKIIKEESIRFYVSPYIRAKQTYEHINLSFKNNKTSIVIDPRLREQEFGNLFCEEIDSKKARLKIGKFYYRFAQGESGSDCFDRLTMFIDSMYKDFTKNVGKNRIDNAIIVCHGLTMRLFLMNFCKMSIEQFQAMMLPLNCNHYLLEKNRQGKYELKTKIKYYPFTKH